MIGKKTRKFWNQLVKTYFRGDNETVSRDGIWLFF